LAELTVSNSDLNQVVTNSIKSSMQPFLGIAVKKVRPGAILPKQATPLSAGFDLHACLDMSVTFIGVTKDAVLIPTGIAVDMTRMSPHMVGLIFPRSGLGHKHGMVLGNGVGVIDPDYQGEIMVSMCKRSPSEFTIKPGDRIAQIVFMPIMACSLIEVDEFAPSVRGSGGFGSTGV
jgi:deoxyuridine 5'-triphosphate nucleotidohydrolase